MAGIIAPLFDLSMASMRSNSSKSERRIGLEIDVSFTPLFKAAAFILESAGLPYITNTLNQHQLVTDYES